VKIGPYEIGTIDAKVLCAGKIGQEDSNTMARKGPLRRVVEHLGCLPGEFTPSEKLECGHIQRVVQDIYGPTNAYKRRCRQCWKLANPAPRTP